MCMCVCEKVLEVLKINGIFMHMVVEKMNIFKWDLWMMGKVVVSKY